jgi:hypothetical protein
MWAGGEDEREGRRVQMTIFSPTSAPRQVSLSIVHYTHHLLPVLHRILLDHVRRIVAILLQHPLKLLL